MLCGAVFLNCHTHTHTYNIETQQWMNDSNGIFCKVPYTKYASVECAWNCTIAEIAVRMFAAI